MNNSRGFHFLVGIAILWLVWRLYVTGVFQDWGFMAAGMPVNKGPGAVMIGFIIEAVITVGWVTTLIASGLWDVAMILFKQLGDMAMAGRSYLYAVAKHKQLIVKAKTPAPEIEPAVLTPEEGMTLVIIETRKEVDGLNTKIDSILKALKNDPII